MKQFLYKQEEGEIVAYDNPSYTKHLQIEKYNLYLKQSGIPDFYHNIEFKDYQGDKTGESYRKILYYAEHCHEPKFNHVSLYLYGSHGCQKSALMYNILKQCIKKGMKVKSILAGSLINKLMKLQGFNRDFELEREIKELKSCDIIGIDDVGDIEKSMQWEKSSLITVEWDNFFREVLASKTKVIMTSNFDILTFKKFFSDSIYELLDRNTTKIYLSDSIKKIRMLNVEDAFKEME